MARTAKQTRVLARASKVNRSRYASGEERKQAVKQVRPVHVPARKRPRRDR